MKIEFIFLDNEESLSNSSFNFPAYFLMKTLNTLLCDALTSLNRLVMASNLCLNFIASSYDFGEGNSVDDSLFNLQQLFSLKFLQSIQILVLRPLSFPFPNHTLAFLPSSTILQQLL